MAQCKNCVHYEVCQYVPYHEIEEECTCADFKDKFLFVELPCKVGDTVYRICGTRKNKYIAPRIVNAITFHKDSITIHSTADDALGVTVFITKKAAEKRLKELKENE